MARVTTLLLAFALIVCGCSTAPVPTNLASGQPSSLRTPSPGSSTHVTTPSPVQTSSLVPGAELIVIGDGKLLCNSPGGCGAVLLLQPADQGPLPALLDYEAPMQFEINRPNFEHARLLGPVIGAPARLQPGRWLVGLGQSYSSDFASCDAPCVSPYFESGTGLVCSDEFVVGPETEKVRINAHFGANCRIEVLFTAVIID
jgi:hypothetical protein